MSLSIPNELIQANKLIIEGNHDAAINLINSFEQREGHILQDNLTCQLLKCEILFQQGLYEDLLNIAEQAYKDSLELGLSLLSLDLLMWKARALMYLFKVDDVLNIISEGEKHLENLKQELPLEYKQREATIAFVKALFYFWEKRDADLALEQLNHCLALREQFGTKPEITLTNMQIAKVLIYGKGEFYEGAKYLEHGMTLAKELNNKYNIAWGLLIMAVKHGYNAMLYLMGSDYNIISGKSANFNSISGICLNSSDNNTIFGNAASSKYYGGHEMFFEMSNNNAIKGNTVSNSPRGGMSFSECEYNIISGNLVQNCSSGISMGWLSTKNIISRNTLNNNDLSGISLGYANYNLVLENNAGENSICGIYVTYSSHNSITENTANHNNYNGIMLYHSNYNNITENNANNNNKHGIELIHSDYNIVGGNTLLGNLNSCIYEENCEGNIFENNVCKIVQRIPFELIILGSIIGAGALIGVVSVVLIRRKRK
ncbi:MAG: nitrous oxide reductase family maturation protein NosD [Promethearchaeota archaeon]